MPNSSRSRRRPVAPPPRQPLGAPSRQPMRYPRRGLAALVLTMAGLALLVSFRSPSDLAMLTTTEVRPGQVQSGQRTQATPAAAQGDGATGDSGAGDMPPATPASPNQDVPADVGGGSGTNQSDPGSGNGSTGTSGNGSTGISGNGSGAAQAEQVIAGDTVRTRFGPVQVQVTLAGNTVTDVQALQLPFDHPQSARISQIVEPMLQGEALRVQYGRMRLVSGATYTSRAYAMSLQSALDRAG